MGLPWPREGAACEPLFERRDADELLLWCARLGGAGVRERLDAGELALRAGVRERDECDAAAGDRDCVGALREDG